MGKLKRRKRGWKSKDCNVGLTMDLIRWLVLVSFNNMRYSIVVVFHRFHHLTDLAWVVFFGHLGGQSDDCNERRRRFGVIPVHVESKAYRSKLSIRRIPLWWRDARGSSTARTPDRWSPSAARLMDRRGPDQVDTLARLTLGEQFLKTKLLDKSMWTSTFYLRFSRLDDVSRIMSSRKRDLTS